MYTVKKIMCKSTELQLVLFRKAFLSDCVNTHLKIFGKVRILLISTID